MIPTDKLLYEICKIIIYSIYAKNSAYRSGALQKLYKSYGGKYKNELPSNIDKTPLKRWFLEDWKDIQKNNKNNKLYPLYRPTIKITAKTPKIVNEITPEKIQKQSKLKQIYRGKKNLPKF